MILSLLIFVLDIVEINLVFENEKNMRAHQGQDADEEVSFRVSEPQAYLQIATQESLAKNTLDQEEIEAHHSELI